jgi:hypothetical protein
MKLLLCTLIAVSNEFKNSNIWRIWGSHNDCLLQCGIVLFCRYIFISFNYKFLLFPRLLSTSPFSSFILLFLVFLSLGSTEHPIQWVPGDPSLGVKRPGREVDHSSSSSAEVKNGGAIPPLPLTSSWHNT